MDITFKGRQTDVPDRFRKHATAKLQKLEKLDQKAIRVDVEISVERNPRQASQKERVELTISSRGPAIRAEAGAEDRFAAFDLAVTRLESRLRRARDRRKHHKGARTEIRLVDQLEAEALGLTDLAAVGTQAGAGEAGDDAVPIPMEGGDGPLLVRQKFHHSEAMTIDQALFEMELVGHDFYLFKDMECHTPSVVYRRRGYQYGVIRLVEMAAENGRGADVDAGSAASAANGLSSAGSGRQARRQPVSAGPRPGM